MLPIALGLLLATTLIVGVVAEWQSKRAKQRLLARLRAGWGRVVAGAEVDDEDVAGPVARRFPMSRARILAAAASLIGIVLSPAAGAQLVQVAATPDTEAGIIAQLEADGARYQRLAYSATAHPMLVPSNDGPGSALPSGTADRKCVQAFGFGPTRSGEFVIGGEIGVSVATRPAKIWWGPLHHGKDMPPLLVVGHNLASPSDSFTFTTSEIVLPIRSPRDIPPEVERRYFFPSVFVAPRPGRWALVARSGPNWGCFLHTVH